MMQQAKTMGVVLLALFAFSAVAATVAQAEEAPYWSIEGTRLGAGKTAEITVKAATNQVLVAAGITVTCTALAVEKGAVLLGSEPGEPGKSNETLHYTGCTVTGNGTGCTVTNSEVKTNPLTSELAYAANKKSLVGEFKPATGKKLSTLKFTGSGCTETETALEGQVVVGVLTDPGEVLVELPNAVTSAGGWFRRIIQAVRNKIWLIIGGTGTEVETAELRAFGHEATLAGTASLSLASGKSWGPLL
jgi:hypothetical protein